MRILACVLAVLVMGATTQPTDVELRRQVAALQAEVRILRTAIESLRMEVANLHTPASQPVRAKNKGDSMIGMTLAQLTRTLGKPQLVSEDEAEKQYEWVVWDTNGKRLLSGFFEDDRLVAYEWQTLPTKPLPKKTQPAREFRGTEGIP